MSTSRLLALPRELRDSIYEYAFIGEPKVYLHDDSHEAHNSGLLSTCKQVRAEALPLYYEHTIFYWSKHFDFDDMQRLVPKAILRSLATLRLEAGQDDCDLANMELVSDCIEATIGLELKDGVLKAGRWSLGDGKERPEMTCCSAEELKGVHCTCPH